MFLVTDMRSLLSGFRIVLVRELRATKPATL
jgi:hypothetical protein